MDKVNSQDYLEELSDELSMALGKAIWTFAKIEALTFEYIKKLSRDDLNSLLDNPSISSRIKLIRKLIDRIKGFDIEKAQALVVIKEIETLLKDRNTIAHNPWLIWIDLELNDFVTEIHNPSKATHKLNLNSVNAFTDKAGSLVLKLRSALIPLSICHNQF
jgi:hypothetical protein